MHDDGAAPAPEAPAPRPEQAAPGAPHPRRRRGPRLPMLVAILLTVPILVVTFMKEPEPETPVTIGDMRQHYGWHGATLLLFDTLERRFPADVAGAEIGADEQHSGWVGFRADVPPGARVLLASYRADARNGAVEVVPNLGFTAAEMRNRVAAAEAALGELAAVGEGTVRLDKRTGVLEIAATRTDGGPADDAGFRDDILDAIDERLVQEVEPWAEGARATDDVQPVRFGPADASAPAPSGLPTPS